MSALHSLRAAGVQMSSGHSAELVLLSIVIACTASFAALFLAGHGAHARSRFGWLIGSAWAMGIGIWSMHFIAVLAYRLPVSVGYDVSMLALSLLVAVVGSGIGLAVAGQVKPRISWIVVSGPVMGLAIVGMHYIGMAAMRLPATLHYDGLLVAASVVIAVVASYAAIALFLRFRFDRSRRGAWLKVFSAVVMGHAVSGMHFTAMAAVHFEHSSSGSSATGLLLPPAQLAVAIAACTLVVLGLAVGGTMLDRWAGTVREVRRSEERFRVMVAAIQDHAIFTVDIAGRIDSWNRGAERLLGYDASEIVGQPLSRIYPGNDEAEVKRELQQAAELGRYETEGSRVAKHGEVRRVNVTTSAMRDAQGNLLGYARILRDITRQIQAKEELARHEEQLRQAQKMEAVGQLAGGVAHDFNNMLTAIRGYADLLRDQYGSQTDAATGLEEITKAVDRAAALTRQLLAFSRKQVLQPRPLDPNQVVSEMENMLRRLLVGDVELLTALSANAGQITVDPAQLQQVLLNLALNARDAMPKGGHVVIRTANVDLDDAFCRDHEGANPGPHVALSVADNGIGMSSDVQEHIFEPFFTTKELGAGTGLGLSTVYGIVKQSGGYISVESHPGKGTTFRIYFPRTTEPCSARAVRKPAALAPAPRATILLVDDEESVRRLIAALLERHGYTVLSAIDGVDALAVSEAFQGTIDLLITDMMMPRMHGRELSQRLAKMRPEMPVLFTSGYAGHEIVERGLLDPRMAFIQKPFTMTDLVAKVRVALASELAQAG